MKYLAFLVLYSIVLTTFCIHKVGAEGFYAGNSPFYVMRMDYQPETKDKGGYFPPRIQQLCNDNFIGTDWDKSMKYEKRCRVLWNAWTKDMLQVAHDNWEPHL